MMNLMENKLNRRRLVRKKLGQKTIYPTQSEAPDVSTTLFHNIGSNVILYTKFKSGVILPMRYMEVDTDEKGIFVVDRYPNIYNYTEELSIEIRDSLRASKLITDGYGDINNGSSALIESVTSSRISDVRDDIIDQLSRSIDQSDIDFRDMLINCPDLRQYNFISVEEFNNDTHIMLEDYNIMISLNDRTTPYPIGYEYDSVKSGIAITIHNSINPTKVYYAKLLGKIIKIPVKNDNKRDDGVIITNNIMSVEEELETYDLSDLESLGIYENIEDAEHSGDAELQLKLKELDFKSKDLLSKDKSNEAKKELEELKHTREQEQHTYDKFKAEQELNKLERERKIEELKIRYEKEKLLHEKEVNELKKEVEQIKANATTIKSSHDAIGSTWKMIGGIVTGLAAIIGVVWKLFF